MTQMIHGRLGSLLLLLAVVLLASFASAAHAADSGSVAAIEGQADVSRGGTWTPLALGDRVAPGDRIRTRRPGRLRLVFEDDTVLVVGDDTEISVAAALFDPGAPGLRSIFGLVRGKLRALVSDAYAKRGAKFEIETVTATVGVRGTEFVIVYDPVAEVTDAVGVNGTTEVHSVLDRVGQGVFVTNRELTQVFRGSYPTPLRKLDETTFRQYLDGLEFIGGGQDESVTIGDLILSGGMVDSSESADNAAPFARVGQSLPGPGFLGFPQREEVAPFVGPEDNFLPPSLVDEPMDVLQGDGDVEIEF